MKTIYKQNMLCVRCLFILSFALFDVKCTLKFEYSNSIKNFLLRVKFAGPTE